MITKLIAAAIVTVGAGCADVGALPEPPTPEPKVVTVGVDEAAPDMHGGDVLNVRFDPANMAPVWGQAWGGDASLEWADTECLDMGGDPVWEGGHTLTCTDVDF